MDVKNNIVTNLNIINAYAGENSGLLECGGKTNNIDARQTEMIPSENKTDLQSNNFAQSNEEEYSKKELDDALKKVNNFLKDEKTHAEYAIHEDFGTLMIKIVDDDTKKILLEIPPKKILDMVASMCRQVGLLDKKA